MAGTAIFLVCLAVLAVFIAILAALSSIIQKWVCDQGCDPSKRAQAADNEDQHRDQLEEVGVVSGVDSHAVNVVAHAIDAYHHKRDTHERARSKSEKVTIIVLGMTALFAALAAAASLVSDWIFYKQLVDSRNATIIANRAWIAPSRMVLNWPLEIPGPVRVSLAVENTGREPAIDVVYAFRSFLVSYIPEGPGNAKVEIPNLMCDGLDPQSIGGQVIYPAKTSLSITSDIKDTIGNRAMAIAARDRSQTLIVEGCIAYRTFEKVHTSKFRFFLRDVPGPSCIPIDIEHINCAWQFHPIGIGNEAN